MPIRILSIILLLLDASGCGVSAGNPDTPSNKLGRVEGIVAGEEDGTGVATPLNLWAKNGSVSLQGEANEFGYFSFSGVPFGEYLLVVGETFEQDVLVNEKVVFADVFLPVPAAISDVKVYVYDSTEYCVLWRDNSGLEAGFLLEGQGRTVKLPTNSIGFSSGIYGYGDTAETLPQRNPKTSGRYTVTAWNEYGKSAPVEITLPNLETMPSYNNPPTSTTALSDEVYRKCHSDFIP